MGASIFGSFGLKGRVNLAQVALRWRNLGLLPHRFTEEYPMVLAAMLSAIVTSLNRELGGPDNQIGKALRLVKQLLDSQLCQQGQAPQQQNILQAIQGREQPAPLQNIAEEHEASLAPFLYW